MAELVGPVALLGRCVREQVMLPQDTLSYGPTDGGIADSDRDRNRNCS